MHNLKEKFNSVEFLLLLDKFLEGADAANVIPSFEGCKDSFWTNLYNFYYYKDLWLNYELPEINSFQDFVDYLNDTMWDEIDNTTWTIGNTSYLISYCYNM